MAQETFFDKVREFIGSIAWSIFLWSIRMSEDEYLDAVVRESGITQRELDAACACAVPMPCVDNYALCSQCRLPITPRQ